MSNVISDSFGRQLKYLRISVTDRCNFRCRYCMPSNTFTHIECENILRYEDILFAAEAFAELGVNRIRVTGGEPLVRKDICGFLGRLTKIPGINEVMLTTNGALLPKFAVEIYEAGVRRLNISLDSLKEERGDYITGVKRFRDTMEGIRAAVRTGFSPIKVNAVIIRGFNDDEIGDFCRFAADEGIIVRFIEFMPIGNSAEWNKDSIVTGSEILERIAPFMPEPLKKDENTGPARNYRLNNGGTVGIITPISRHFCGDCDKLRLTSDGKIRPCLLSDREINLNEAIRAKDSAALKELILEAVVTKGREHDVSAGEKNEKFKRTMSKIGG